MVFDFCKGKNFFSKIGFESGFIHTFESGFEKVASGNYYTAGMGNL